MPTLNHPYRQNPEQALEAIEVMEKTHERLANGFYTPPTIWQVFERNALLIIGGSLFGAAVLYLASLIRGAM